MKHIVYDTAADTYPLAILVKEAAFNAHEIDRAYIQPLESHGVDRNDIIVVAVPYNSVGKAPVSFVRERLEQIMTGLASVGTRHILCADANYFKILAKEKKADPHLGYCLPCGLEDYDHISVVLGINHKALIHNPSNEPKLALSLQTFAAVVSGKYSGLGQDIIQAASYPSGYEAIQQALEDLHQYPVLTADIEAFSLDFEQAGVGTCSFAWSQHEGMAFSCDYAPRKVPNRAGEWGEFRPNHPVRELLRNFLETYQGTLIWHKSTYDLKCIIYTLWMKDLNDHNGMLKGLETLTERFHDTKVIAYLAINSTAGNELGLKILAHPFAGNYAEDVTNIRLLPEQKLLRYNLVDTLSTFWVFNTYYPQMVKDMQLDLYRDLMLPSQKTIIQMELVGMPLDPRRVQEARGELQAIIDAQVALLSKSPLIKQTEALLTERARQKDFEDRKVKAKNPEKLVIKEKASFPRKTFNPASNQQCQCLLYEVMALPVIDTTKTKQPGTGGDTLEKLLNHTTDTHAQSVIQALVDYSKANKILSSFIPAFEKALDKGQDVHWLHGNFNLGGTVSGRLSSSDPNLQNIPSGSTFGKLIKSCFRAPKGWIFCGADFASLEDRINALITKDPNKLKVYTDGFDGHALRAVNYWPHEFPGLDPNDPVQVNQVKKDDHPLRQRSKTPTFALTYQGTWITLVRNSGFTPEEAKKIEASYHLLYAVSTQWVKERIDQAAKDGYAEAAFGLRIRTPMLARTYLGKSSTPREAEAEARTLGNAISGQSYGLLTNRAANAVMARVWKSPYRFDILPVAMIHDAIYFVCRDDADVVAWLNRVLIEEMAWQKLPEIQHDKVKLGAELDLFWPSWAHGITLPNNATPDEILDLCQAATISYQGNAP